jgi:hypothetical protein
MQSNSGSSSALPWVFLVAGLGTLACSEDVAIQPNPLVTGGATSTSAGGSGVGGIGSGPGGIAASGGQGSAAAAGGQGSAGTGAGGQGTGGTATGGVGGGATGGSAGTGGNPNPGSCPPPTPGTNPGRVCIRGKNYYLNGVNVAWDQWTADLTNYDAGKFEAMFSAIAASGGNAVRWWWFIDGESQLSFSGNLVQPLPQKIFDNLDVAFDAAATHGILIMPVFLSFDIENRNREFLVTDAAATDAFVVEVVTPLVKRYNDHPGLGLWEIMNEGDWLLTPEGGTVSVSDYQRFHGKVAAGIHAADGDALVTTGSASFKYLEGSNNILSDAALRSAAGGDPLSYLDVYQTHYYGWMHGDGWSYEPWIKTSGAYNGEGKPILIGEFPCKGEAGRWSTLQMHTGSVTQGYAGTFCWAYFDDRADDEGTWSDAQAGVAAVAAQIPNAITGE